MTVDKKALIKALKNKRESDGLSIRALSEKIGVSFSSLARIERGEGKPDNNSAIRILEWLGDDARVSGLGLENIALVHFRAAKNVRSKTVRCLLEAAQLLRTATNVSDTVSQITNFTESESPRTFALSVTEMEEMATDFRNDLGIACCDRLEALSIRISGVDVYVISTLEALESRCRNFLIGPAQHEWSAMSVPRDIHEDSWAILRNDKHSLERQRVTYLEECWHILLGHRLTKIARVGGSYGRTYDSSEEHDAFFLAAASMLPGEAIKNALDKGDTVESLARKFGTSRDLVEYRIKRLGLWRIYKNRSIVIE